MPDKHPSRPQPLSVIVRMQAVRSPVIPIVGDMVRQRPGTISLGQGVVYYGPPDTVEKRLQEFAGGPSNHKYGAVEGIPPLLEALAAKLRTDNGIDTGAGTRIVVTAGGNMAFMNAVMAIADVDDEVILLTPFYFNHDMAIRMAGCRSVPVPTDDFFQLDLQAVEKAITPRTRAVVSVSPNNPSGAVYPETALRALNALCARHGLYHIHDEAYEYFTYDGARHFSPGSIPGSGEHTISLYSLSKSYGMASWRMGYMVIPESLFVPVKKIQDTILICPPLVSQYAALGALDAGPAYCREKMGVLRHVRETMLEELSAIADICTVSPSGGAFYFLLKVKSDAPPMRIVERLVHGHGVAAMPGDAFGLENLCSLRVAYGALDESTAAEGIHRLVQGLRALT